MAKAHLKTGGNSHIRVVMVEADLAEGELSQLIPALQNALRGPPLAVPRIAPPVSKTVIAEIDEPDVDAPAEEEPDSLNGADQAATRQRSPRKPAPTPNVVDIEMDSDTSLVKFADGKDSKSHHKRFLIAAAWLKEHRGTDAISADHIYTCYRKLGWPTGIPDFAQPLRDLKAKKYLTQSGRGKYAINHIGLDYVKKLGGSE